MNIKNAYQSVNFPDGSTYHKDKDNVETIKDKAGKKINKSRSTHEKSMKDKNKGKVIVDGVLMTKAQAAALNE